VHTKHSVPGQHSVFMIVWFLLMGRMVVSMFRIRVCFMHMLMTGLPTMSMCMLMFMVVGMDMFMIMGMAVGLIPVFMGMFMLMMMRVLMIVSMGMLAFHDSLLSWSIYVMSE